MATTPERICNLALQRCGSSIQIANLATDTSKEARICNLQYEQCRDHVLSDFPWAFATTRKALAELTVDPPEDWDFIYQYPTDCLRAHRIIPLSGERYRLFTSDRQFIDYVAAFDSVYSRIPFHIETNEAGSDRVILTDEESAILVYTKKITAASAFPPSFVTALSLYVAYNICMPLRIEDGRRKEIFNEYAGFLTVAQAQSLNERREDPEALPPSISARL